MPDFNITHVTFLRPVGSILGQNRKTGAARRQKNETPLRTGAEGRDSADSYQDAKSASPMRNAL